MLTSFTVCWCRKQLEELEGAGMLRGEVTATQQLALLSSYDDMAKALEGAFFVQVTHMTSSRGTRDRLVSAYVVHFYLPLVCPSHI